MHRTGALALGSACALALVAGCDVLHGRGEADIGRGNPSGASPGGAEGEVPSPGDSPGGSSSAVAVTGLTALAANGTVGLEWSPVPGAGRYRVYWSTLPEVTPGTSQHFDVDAAAGTVHRGLLNGVEHAYVVTALTAAGESAPSEVVRARPSGEWVLEALGTGDFDDVLTGARLPRLPLSRRIHVLLLPEGYLQTELAVFHEHERHSLDAPTNDVDRWQAEVFALAPYSTFREAFVVWYLPRASAGHINSASTAFGTDASTASAPLWSAIDGAGPDAFPFPPTATSLNHTVSFLLFDPSLGRAGISGHATTCRHPTDSSLALRCAFGIDHAHEFTHVLGNVRDEYIENSNTYRTTVPTENIAATNRCNELPWAHLLAGRGLHDTPGLVGAFGRPDRGYHSELWCQMNGSHENGQYWCSGGYLSLRTNRFCNWCRELLTFRIFERAGLLAGSSTDSFELWKSRYRAPFWARFPVFVPAQVPQTLRCGGGAPLPVFEDCAP